MKTSTVTFFLIVAVVYQVEAWGPTGHRATGYIADLYLSKEAKTQLQTILKGQSLAMASTWMDEVRSDSTYDYMTDWHWVTIPDGKTYAVTDKNPNGDVILTIERIISELKNKLVSGDKEAQYVRMLIHLIGDIHTPLHVGREGDRGGNSIKLSWFKTESNLHRIWDEDMLNETRLSFTELAQSLDKPTNEQLSKWRKSSVLDWAMESYDLRSKVYDYQGTRLGYEYAYYHMPIVRERLLQAGVRIAQVLNEIYGK